MYETNFCHQMVDITVKVTGVVIQGRADANQWVTKFQVQYGNDGVN